MSVSIQGRAVPGRRGAREPGGLPLGAAGLHVAARSVLLPAGCGAGRPGGPSPGCRGPLCFWLGGTDSRGGVPGVLPRPSRHWDCRSLTFGEGRRPPWASGAAGSPYTHPGAKGRGSLRHRHLSTSCEWQPLCVFVVVCFFNSFRLLSQWHEF